MRIGKKIKKVSLFLAAGGLAVTAGVLTGCVKHSGGTWMFKSAPTPEGWPELTPIGEVALREYPTYRQAIVRREGLPEGEAGMYPMFRSLFDHISSNDIAMTAPVDMAYSEGSPRGSMESMAFLYETRELGPVGTDGSVIIEDVEPMTFASVGVRGDYTDDNYREGLELLEVWAAGQSEWDVIGEPRYLGYNGPFTPPFWKYGEVQVPVRRAAR
ncbi:MAG: heme-binding protein [Planctomycetota bacterium]